jgi:glycosyltransferase involved in cell wall biosynthesis
MPVLNESQNLDKVITSLIEVKVIFECNDVKSVKNADSPERLEIIIADGGSNDDSKEIIDQIKEKLKSTGAVIKFLECIQKGRGNQLNEGAKESCNKLLLFVHADSQLPPHYDTTAWHMLMRPGVAAGAFNFGLDVVHNEEKRYIMTNP